MTDAPEAPPPGPSSVAGNSARLLAARAVGNAGFLLAVLALARGLGPSGRGTIAFITVTAVILGRVTSLGVTNATSVFAAQRGGARPRLLSNLVAFSSAGALAAALVVVALLGVFESVRPSGMGPRELALLVPGTVAASLVEALYFFLIGCSRFRAQALVTATVPWIYALALAAVALGPGLTVARAVAVWAAVSALWAGLLFLASVRGVGIAAPDLGLLGESIRFGLRAWAGDLSWFLNFRLDQVLLAFLSTEAILGVYAVAVNAGEVLFYLPVAVATALLPTLAAGGDRRGERTLATFRAVVTLTFLAGLVAALLGPPLLPLVFGAEFEASAVPFLLLLPGALAFAALQLFSTALLGTGTPGRSSLGPVSALLTSIVLDVLLIPPYGAEGAAIAASVSLGLGAVVAIAAYHSVTAFRWGDAVPRPGDVAAVARRVRARSISKTRR